MFRETILRAKDCMTAILYNNVSSISHQAVVVCCLEVYYPLKLDEMAMVFIGSQLLSLGLDYST